jgi:hypothetical protein
MKKSFYILLILSVLLPSCLNNVPQENYYVGAICGSAEKVVSASVIKMDDSTRVLINNAAFPDSILGLRFFANGKLYKDQSAGFDFSMDAANIFQVPVLELKNAVNQNVIDELGTDGTVFNSKDVYQTGKYLNILFGFYAKEPSKHFFNFAINEKDQISNSQIKLYFCHNNGDDAGTVQYVSFLSMDLTPLFNRFTDNFKIKFVYYNENRIPKDFEINITHPLRQS